MPASPKLNEGQESRALSITKYISNYNIIFPGRASHGPTPPLGIMGSSPSPELTTAKFEGDS